MSESIARRAVLKKASLGLVAGVAATSGIARLPELLGDRDTGSESAPDLSPLGENVVAHVRNASTGEVAILAGDREVIKHDPALVGRLLGAARAKGEAS